MPVQPTLQGVLDWRLNSRLHIAAATRTVGEPGNRAGSADAWSVIRMVRSQRRCSDAQLGADPLEQRQRRRHARAVLYIQHLNHQQARHASPSPGPWHGNLLAPSPVGSSRPWFRPACSPNWVPRAGGRGTRRPAWFAAVRQRHLGWQPSQFLSPRRSRNAPSSSPSSWQRQRRAKRPRPLGRSFRRVTS